MTPTITITDLARGKLVEYLSEEPGDTVVRLLVEENGKYGLSLDQSAAGDVAVAGSGEIQVVVEGAFARVVDGLKVDYLDQGASSGFSLTGGKAGRGGKPVVEGSEATPNPEARKFLLSIFVGGSPRTFTTSEGSPPGVTEALALDGVTEVFLLERFATVTKAPETDWESLEKPLEEALSSLEEAPEQAAAGPAGDALESRVARFLVSDVAPFLQRDGGDIELVGVEGGVAKVRLRGACGSCPSATATLHAGVEQRLKSEFSELERLERV